jgi:hypothetical protein
MIKEERKVLKTSRNLKFENESSLHENSKVGVRSISKDLTGASYVLP